MEWSLVRGVSQERDHCIPKLNTKVYENRKTKHRFPAQHTPTFSHMAQLNRHRVLEYRIDTGSLNTDRHRVLEYRIDTGSLNRHRVLEYRIDTGSLNTG